MEKSAYPSVTHVFILILYPVLDGGSPLVFVLYNLN